MKKIELEIISNNLIEIKSGLKEIKKIISIKDVYFRKGQFRKIKKVYDKTLIDTKTKTFHPGWIPRIEIWANENDYNFILNGEFEEYLPIKKPSLPNIEFREKQLEAIRKINRNQTGIINAATGYGKTLTVAGLITTYDAPKVLFLCRSNDLVNQTFDVFSKYFDCCKIGSGQKEINSPIVIATAQTYKNMDLLKYSDLFDIVVVDEAHEGVKKGSEYETILSSCLAPIRVGLTATIPSDDERKMMLEGLFGKIQVEVDINEGAESGALIKPTVKLINSKMPKGLGKYKTYRDIYNNGICLNFLRNEQVVEVVESENESGSSVLIFVVEINHLENISKELKRKNITYEVVYGDIKSEKRKEIQEKLNKKEIMCVLASIVWVKGLDVPTLDVIINASGRKGEEELIQKLGRVVRKIKGKKKAIVYDFLDDHKKYLAEHSIKRVMVYNKNGWL